MAANRRALTRSRKKESRATFPSVPSRVASPLLKKRAALRRIKNAVAEVLSREYLDRYALNFKIASTWRGSILAPSVEQVRNSLDHLARAIVVALDITELETSGHNVREASLQLEKLCRRATRHIARAKRHMELGNYLAVEATIKKVYVSACHLLDQLGDAYPQRIKDEDELDGHYNTFLEMERPSTERAHNDLALEKEIQKTRKIADDVNQLVALMTDIFERSDLALKAARS
jgi:hypothetical protein